jgi:ribosomal protein S14
MPSGDVIRLIRRGFNPKLQKLYVTHATRRENMEEFKNLLRKFDAITTLDKPKKKESPLFTVADLNHVEDPFHRSFQRLTTQCVNCGRPGHMMRSCRNTRLPTFRTPRPSTPSRTPELTPPRTLRFQCTTRQWSRPSTSPFGDRLSQRGESSSRTPFRGMQQRSRGTGPRGRG